MFKQIPMIKIQNSKPIHDLEARTTQWLGHWILGFGLFLYFGACVLVFAITCIKAIPKV